MLAKDLITDNIASVTGSDTVDRAVELMARFRILHLPVISESGYLGLISEKDIMEIPLKGQLIGAGIIHFLAVSAMENQHIYEVIDLMDRHNLTILPVVSAGKDYLGCITLPGLLKNFILLTAAGQPGAILVFNLEAQDYSPTLLSRIIEDNNAKILSLYVVTDPNSRELTVTIKVNTQETSSMMRSFDRYGYSVRSFSLTNTQLDDFYRSRYEEFMKYMNI